eukprot:g14870.t1
MVYTQMAEVFTSVAVEFEIDEAGNVIGLARLKSYVDLDDYGTKGWFVFCNLMVILFVGLGVCHSLYLVTCCGQNKITATLLYELGSRCFMLVFNLWLLFGFLGLKPMKVEYSDLMHTFMTLHDFSHHGLITAVQHFFEVKDHIYEENDLIYDELCDLIPQNLRKAFADTITGPPAILLVFAVLFVVMAFVGHWQFASMLPADFGTVGRAMEWQFRMIIGDFPFDGWIEMDTTQQFMFWMYLILFALIMFLTMMNFFLGTDDELLFTFNTN